MADIKKDQEREELHRAIWAIADELRGSVDGWDFKSYVLGMMFYRYISENLANYIKGKRKTNTKIMVAGDISPAMDSSATGCHQGLIYNPNPRLERAGDFLLRRGLTPVLPGAIMVEIL